MAYGDLGAAAADFIEYDTTNGQFAACVKVADGIIAIFNSANATGTQGTVRTYPIAADGTIGALVDSWEFESNKYIAEDNVFEVATGIFLTIYRGDSDVLTAQTIAIASDGTITKTAIDTLATAVATPGTVYCSRKGTLNVYCACWTGDGQDGFVGTITCAADGTGLATADDWEFEPARGFNPRIAWIQGDVFCVSYYTATDGTIATFDIDDSGNITKSLIDTQVIDSTRQASAAAILKLDGDLVVVAYTAGVGGGFDGWMSTFTIDSAGTISAPIDSLEYDPTSSVSQKLIDLGADSGVSYFAVFYAETSSDDTIVRTYSLDASGNISAQIDAVTLRSSTGQNAYGGVQVRENLFAFIMVDTPGADGFLYTATMEAVQAYAATWPLLALTRVTNLIHRYDRNEQVFTLEIHLGDVTSDFGLPQWVSQPIPPRLPDGPMPLPGDYPTSDLIPDLSPQIQGQLVQDFTPTPGATWEGYTLEPEPQPQTSIWREIGNLFNTLFNPSTW